MSIITRFLAVVTEPQFNLARDLTAMAIADDHVTPEEMEALRAICHLEGVDQAKLMEALQGGYDHVTEEMPTTRALQPPRLASLCSTERCQHHRW